MADFRVLILGRRPVILPKVQGQREGERKISEPKETTKSLRSPSFLPALPPSSLCLHTNLWATSWNVKWLVVTATGEGPVAGRTGGHLCEQNQQALQRALLLQSLPISKARG